MSEKKAPEAEKRNPRELELDELDAVQGGAVLNPAIASIHDVRITPTQDISEDTRNKS
ncbi:MAG: hypothetical protein IJQ81_11930 [Oscillibacter sp.]|nr:hypothetical protein [Oscillibacter sp.]